jgi:hypothetical protein
VRRLRWYGCDSSGGGGVSGLSTWGFDYSVSDYGGCQNKHLLTESECVPMRIRYKGPNQTQVWHAIKKNQLKCRAHALTWQEKRVAELINTRACTLNVWKSCKDKPKGKY